MQLYYDFFDMTSLQISVPPVNATTREGLPSLFIGLQTRVVNLSGLCIVIFLRIRFVFFRTYKDQVVFKNDFSNIMLSLIWL